MVEGITLPPEEAVYQITVPVAVTAMLDTRGRVMEQKVCAAVPVGGAGIAFTVAVTAVRAADIQFSGLIASA